MLLLIKGILVLLASSIICQRTTKKTTVKFRHTVPRIPDTYKDVFLVGPGPHKRPTLGTAKATCWARGGVCIHIRDCPGLNIDVSVAGCTQRYRVCCKNFNFGPPTVGILRKSSELYILSSNLEELEDESIELIARHNIDLLQHII